MEFKITCTEINSTQICGIDIKIPSWENLKKNKIKPHLRDQWCLGHIDSRFIAQMEKVLSIYARPYDPEYPVVSFDERPCQLISHLIEPIAPAPGRNKRVDYQYKRMGVCAVLMAIEPLTGNRVVDVVERRRKKEYTEFMEKLVESYSDAKKIILVQDNLNTHSSSSFYAYREPEEAFKLMEKFEMVYTPRKASWLNMVEIELAALSKQCLDRRIADIETLRKEVNIWTNDRIEKAVKITWEFTNISAREKLNRHYEKIRIK